MRFLPLILLLVAGVWLGYVGLRAAPPSFSVPDERVPAHLSGEIPVGYLVRRFTIDGMCCEGCPKKLFAQVEALAGVREAAIDFEASTAEVVVSETVPVDAILAVLGAEPKYTVRALP